MKKCLLFLFVMCFIATTGRIYGQVSDGAIATFESTEINYGKIEKGSNPIRIFKFRNSGNTPLVITKAQSSCGCLVATYPKEPIMPGATGEIVAKYDTNRPGPFTKYITVSSNQVFDIKLVVSGDVVNNSSTPDSNDSRINRRK